MNNARKYVTKIFAWLNACIEHVISYYASDVIPSFNWIKL